MDIRHEQLRDGLGRFLAEKWQPGATVADLVHIPGGASRETWRFTAAANDASRGMVVRIDPETSLIDTDRRTEYRAIEAAYRSGLPTPEPLFLEEDGQWLGRPFSITAEVPGCQSSPDAFPAQHRQAIGEQKWTWLGKLAALDPDALHLDDVMPSTTADTCAAEQLDYWARIIVADEMHPKPIAEAAIRWLKREAPPRAQKLSLVHGDYRTGNFLYSPGGEIKAILDWEMAHLGDPLEDLAWSLDPLWSWREPKLAGMLLPHDHAIRLWEQASGLSVDRDAFRWWQVFAAVKAIGIWISSSDEFDKSANKKPILAIAGWLMTDRQQRILLDYLSPHSAHRFYEAVA